MSRVERIAVEDLPPGVWRAQVKIRFGQCDAAGIVYTPNYFDIFNGVVEDFFPAVLGLDYYGLLRDERIGLGYAHASADFLSPNLMGEMLEIAVVLGRIGRSSFTLTFHVLKQGVEVARGRFVVVTTAIEGFRPIPIPEKIRAALAAYEARCAA